MYHGERFNGITHLMGTALAAAGATVLVVLAARQGDPWKIVSFSIYGCMLFALYILSTLYHSLRGKAKDVNFYDDLHRRYIEVSGAHGNMLFEPAHTRLAGAWGIDKAQRWLLANLAASRINLDRLVTHHIAPEGLGEAYEGLLKKKDEYLSVIVKWK